MSNLRSSQGGMFLDVQFLNPFLLSLNQVAKNLLGENIQKKKVSILSNTLNKSANIHVFLGVTGDLYGNILLSAEHSSGLYIASTMVGEKVSQFDDLTVSALQELLNITSGNALTKLAKMGFTADISPPAFFTGTNIDIRVAFPLVSVLFSIKDAEFYFNLSLKKKKDIGDMLGAILGKYKHIIRGRISKYKTNCL